MRMRWFLVLLLFCSANLFAQDAAPVSEQKIAALVPAERLADAWWKERHEANKARIAQGNVDLLLVGDSLTQSWDGAGHAVQDYYYGDRNVVNMGFGGDRTQHVLWRLDDAPMDKIHPKAAMVLIGVNNLGSDNEEDTALGIKACVDKLQALYPDIQILLLELFVTGEKADTPIRKNITKVNTLLPGLLMGYKNITFKNLDHLWLDAEGEVSRYVMPDYDHPGTLGCKLWGAEVEPILSQMLGTPEKEPMQ